MAHIYKRKGGEILVNTTTSGNQSAPSIAALAGGGYLVTWVDASGLGGDASVTGVKAQRFDADGNKIGGEFLVNTATANLQSSPTVTTLASGRFVISWTDSSFEGGDPSSFSIKAQLFEADGTKVGSEFLVNTATLNAQQSPQIADLPSGGIRHHLGGYKRRGRHQQPRHQGPIVRCRRRQGGRRDSRQHRNPGGPERAPNHRARLGRLRGRLDRCSLDQRIGGPWLLAGADVRRSRRQGGRRDRREQQRCRQLQRAQRHRASVGLPRHLGPAGFRTLCRRAGHLRSQSAIVQCRRCQGRARIHRQYHHRRLAIFPERGRFAGRRLHHRLERHRRGDRGDERPRPGLRRRGHEGRGRIRHKQRRRRQSVQSQGGGTALR